MSLFLVEYSNLTYKPGDILTFSGLISTVGRHEATNGSGCIYLDKKIDSTVSGFTISFPTSHWLRGNGANGTISSITPYNIDSDTLIVTTISDIIESYYAYVLYISESVITFT